MGFTSSSVGPPNRPRLSDWERGGDPGAEDGHARLEALRKRVQGAEGPKPGSEEEIGEGVQLCVWLGST